MSPRRRAAAAPEGVELSVSADNLIHSRIIRHELRDPAAMEPHPLNWRKHTRAQRQMVESSLRLFGWFESLIWNERTNRLVDGHLRREIAMAWKVTEVPTTVVDLSDEEERLALALFDAIGAMAIDDKAKLNELLVEAQRKDGSADTMMLLAEFYKGLPTAHTPAAPSEQNLEQSRQMQLMLEADQYAQVLTDIETLAGVYGTDNASDTVIKAIEHAESALA